ncbi:DUF2341 domain-containing protein [Saccharicrinis sp. FJH54]|uniref:DUF2341 domain-containing protein n=1 Tax=Saccharicrinis sp. FJH54 TaxID=3344665 RepID=UPI0035D4504A
MKTPFLYFLLAMPMALSAQDCFTDYKFKRTVSLTSETDVTTISAHTVAIPWQTKELYDAGKLMADGTDIRVTDASCNELPFFVQGIPDYENNVLYVRVPDITEEGLTLTVYYGKSSETASKIDGPSVFDLFFDDFEDGELGTDRWTTVGQYTKWTEADGKMTYNGAYGNGNMFLYVTTKAYFEGKLTFDFTASASNSKFFGIADTAGLNRFGFRYKSGARSYDTLDIVATLKDTINGGTSDGKTYPFVKTPRDIPNIVSISAYVDEQNKAQVTHFKNFNTGDENRDTFQVSFLDMYVMRPFFSSFGVDIDMDFVGIRTSPGAYPLIAWNDEEYLATSTKNISEENKPLIYPNPGKGILNFTEGIERPTRITIFDISGKLVYSSDFIPVLHVQHLNSGQYVLKADYPDRQVNYSKFSIEK